MVSERLSDSETTFFEREWNDIDVVTPVILGLVTVIAFLRVMPYLTANDSIGAFQISFDDMFASSSHFFIIPVGVFLAFATGMTFLFKNTSIGSRNVACTFRRGECSGERDVNFET